MEVSNYPKALEQLIEIVRLEQQAKGYPKRCKKMRYSRQVRALALEASRLTHMSSVELAVITKLSKKTISNWRHRIKSEFCELAVRPDAEEIILEKSEKSNSETTRLEACAFEFFLPWGLRLVFERKNSCQSIGVFCRCGFN
jgi:hypothetical protein